MLTAYRSKVETWLKLEIRRQWKRLDFYSSGTVAIRSTEIKIIDFLISSNHLKSTSSHILWNFPSRRQYRSTYFSDPPAAASLILFSIASLMLRRKSADSCLHSAFHPRIQLLYVFPLLCFCFLPRDNLDSPVQKPVFDRSLMDLCPWFSSQ